MIRIQQLGTVVGAVLTTVLQVSIDTNDIGLEISNDGAADLNDFDFAVRFDPDGQWNKVANVGTDYTSPFGWVWSTGIDLTTLAAGTKSWIALKGLAGVDAIRMQAKSGTSTTVSIRGKAQ